MRLLNEREIKSLTEIDLPQLGVQLGHIHIRDRNFTRQHTTLCKTQPSSTGRNSPLVLILNWDIKDRMHRVMMEKDGIIQMSLHIKGNKLKIGSMSNEKVCCAFLVSLAKYFRVKEIFSKYLVLYSDYLTWPNLLTCLLFITCQIDTYTWINHPLLPL